MKNLLLLVLLLCVSGFPASGHCTGWSDATTVPPESGADSFAVQTGRYASEAEALDEAARLRAKGYTPYVLAARATGEAVWYAVRLSLHPDLPQATEAARAFTAKEGREAFVGISGNTEPLLDAHSFFFLQIGAFLERAYAVERRELFRAKGYPAELLQLYDREKNLWYTVSAGTFPTLEEARDAAKALTAKEGAECYINAMDPALYKARLEPQE